MIVADSQQTNTKQRNVLASQYLQTERSAAESTAHIIIQCHLLVVELANSGNLAKPGQRIYFQFQIYFFHTNLPAKSKKKIHMWIVRILLIRTAIFSCK